MNYKTINYNLTTSIDSEKVANTITLLTTAYPELFKTCLIKIQSHNNTLYSAWTILDITFKKAPYEELQNFINDLTGLNYLPRQFTIAKEVK